MNEYLIMVFYVILGLVGLVSHWYKKVFIDETSNDTLKTYIFHDKKSTFNAICMIFSSEVTLAINNSEHFWSLSAVSGAFAVGYTLDSMFNRASDLKLK